MSKLADDLEKAFMTNTSQYFVMPAVAKLREQELQIEALKTQLSYLESKVYGGSTK